MAKSKEQPADSIQEKPHEDFAEIKASLDQFGQHIDGMFGRLKEARAVLSQDQEQSLRQGLVDATVASLQRYKAEQELAAAQMRAEIERLGGVPQKTEIE